MIFKKMLFRVLSPLFCVVFCGCGCLSLNAQGLFKLPTHDSPQEVGKRLAERFIPGPHFLHRNKWIHYPEVCTWVGALRFSYATNDEELSKRLESRFLPLLSSEKDLLPPHNHVDMNMFGSLPLTLYGMTKDRKYLDLGLSYADSQWELPADATEDERRWFEQDLSWQTRMWIDDMYMIVILQVLAYQATGESKYIDRVAREMVYYLDKLQRPNGLFYHAVDVPFYWGRGNGWMAVGLAELLRVLPKEHPDRPRVLAGYVTMMERLLKYQDESGMWNQLVDDPRCWPETSASAMFAYALAVGVNNGWLTSKSSKRAVERAWDKLIQYMNDSSDMMEVCIGTNKKNDRQYYYDRPRITGDLHGQAPMLWLAAELVNRASHFE